MELVGARITILDAIVKQLIGSSGIITACSLNCFYVALDGIIDQKKEDDEKKEDNYSAVTAIKLHKRKVDTASCDIKVADAGNPSSIGGSNNNTHNNNNNNNIVNSNRSDTECLYDHDHDSNSKKKKRQHTQPMKASQLVRAHAVIGVLLPVLVRGKRAHSSSSSSSSSNSGSSCETTITAAAANTTSSSSSTGGNSGGRDDDPFTEDVQVAVLYGKRFMPQAL